MKTLLALFALLPCLAFGQGFGSFYHDQPYLANDTESTGGTPDPQDIEGLARWWVYTDMPTNYVNIGTNVVWVDRMISNILVQGTQAYQPTNTPTGLSFNSNQYLYENTNYFTVSHAGKGDSFWIIFKFQTGGDTFGTLIGGNTDGNYGYTVNTSTGKIVNQPSSGSWYTRTAITANTLADFGLSSVGLNGTNWLNGVADTNHVFSSTNDAVFIFDFVGGDAARTTALKGSILEIAVWTNHPLTLSDAQLLYQYRTNKYGL